MVGEEIDKTKNFDVPTFYNRPKFSVIINNYNYEMYIGEAIESVLNQTFTDFELIIVDDGSTDNSRTIINSFKDERIKVILKRNGGQASAINAGFAVANGLYVSFLDSDDLFDENKLELILNVFKDNGCSTNNKYAVVQHRMKVIDKLGKKKGTLFPPLSYGELNVLPLYFEQKRTSYFSATSGLTVPNHILRKILPLPEKEWKICADAPLTRPLPIFGTIYTVPKPLGSYRIHGKNNYQGRGLTKNQVLTMNDKINKYTNSFLIAHGISNQIETNVSIPV